MGSESHNVVPMIAYEDGPGAMDWLSRAFGFREKTRMLGKDGRLAHGEMDTGGGLIMLATPTPDYESLRHHRESCERAREWSRVPRVIDGVLVYVDNVMEHFQRAKENGAAILSEVEEGPPGRRYRVEDFEGHRGCSWKNDARPRRSRPQLLAPLFHKVRLALRPASGSAERRTRHCVPAVCVPASAHRPGST